jgi:hypothetical protein
MVYNYNFPKQLTAILFFEMRLYMFCLFSASANGERSLLLPRDEARASIDRVLADVGIAPVDAVLKSAAAG